MPANKAKSLPPMPAAIPATKPLPKAPPAAGGAPSTNTLPMPMATKPAPMMATKTKAHGHQPIKHAPNSRGFKK